MGGGRAGAAGPAAVQLGDVGPAAGPSGPPEDTLSGIWQARAGALWCSLDGGFSVAFVPGSGWAWDDASAGGAPVEVAGAQAAALLCEPRDGGTDCALRVLAGETIVEFWYGGSAEEATGTALLIAGAEAALPLLPLVDV